MSGDKLLVWDDPTGEISISQTGGMTEDVIGAYAAMGKRAAFFDLPSLDYGNKFVHRGQLRERPQMLARLDRDHIRADGMDVAKIMGVKRGAQVTMSDGLSEMKEIADGSAIQFTSPIPTRWVISIEAFPYLPQQFVIIAE